MLDYDENIGTIKIPFLTCYDQVETHGQSALYALAFLLWRRLQLREASKVVLAIPKIQDVLQITKLFETHFFYKYKDSKGASRLPVLALYAIYTVLLEELSRFNGKTLKPLEAHSAADAQTGAIGDIEVVDAEGVAFEAIVEMSRNVQSGNTQNLKSMVIQRSFPKWSVAERRKTAAASNQAACCACTHSRYLAGGSPSGLRV